MRQQRAGCSAAKQVASLRCIPFQALHLWSHTAQNVMRTRIPAGIDMNVNVLTSGYWPSYPVIDARLPAELNEYQTVFKDFYLSKHSGRRLVWQNSLGTCVLKSRFSKGTKELSVSLFQVSRGPAGCRVRCNCSILLKRRRSHPIQSVCVHFCTTLHSTLPGWLVCRVLH